MERSAYCPGRGQKDNVPMMSLHVQGQSDSAQLVMRNTGSGNTFPAANIEGSIVDDLSVKPKLVNSIREIQRDCASRVDICHVS